MAEWAKHFEGALDVSPPLEDQQLRHVPAKRGLLLLLAEGDHPLILLSSADIRGRLRSRLQTPADDQTRSRRADLRQVTRKVLWRLAYSHFETDLWYLQFARSIWPEGFVRLLPWRAGHFVHVDPAGAAPHFARTSEIKPSPGSCLGPFRDGRSAARFIETIEDAFDLCRDVARLRQSPHAQPCAYRQMGRCCGVCEGAVSMEEYRALVARAADFARGDRAEYRSQLEAAMKQAAGELRFEQAAAAKAKLAALAELEGPAYRHVAEAERFQFLIFQRGPIAKKLKAFLADRGLIIEGPTIAQQTQKDDLELTVALTGDVLSAPNLAGRYDKWRTALLARYLYSAPQRSGLTLRWQAGLTADRLAEEIERWLAAVSKRVARPGGGHAAASC